VTGITPAIFGGGYLRGLDRESGRVEKIHLNSTVVPRGAAHGRLTMKRSSTFLLAALTALGLAACNPPKSDTGAPAGGTGSESGAMPADTAATTGAPAPGAATTDTGMAHSDTAMKMDTTKK
jgi:hypothetical protein